MERLTSRNTEEMARKLLIESNPPRQFISFKAAPHACKNWHVATNNSPERVHGTLLQHYHQIFEVVSIHDGYDRGLGPYKEIKAREYLERPVENVVRLPVKFEKSGTLVGPK